MVIQSSRLKPRWVSAIQKPPMKNQRTFMKKLRHPLSWSLPTTCEPKGHKARIPNFMVAMPKGMPIIVIIMSNDDTKYSTAIPRPPKISQMMLPKSFKCKLYIRLQKYEKLFD